MTDDTSPKLALLGTGKMGTLVAELAERQEMEVVERFRRERPLVVDEAARERLGSAVLIDFSVPEAVLGHVRASAELGIPLVIGTTGWHRRLDEARSIVEEAGTGCVYAANFSLGVNLFYRLVEHAAREFSAYDSYFPFLQEEHHRFKKDQPSGTALVLRGFLRDAYGDREVAENCLRVGNIPGTHRVGFDSLADTIRLEHQARGRHGFAEGAILAARWIAGRRGFFAFQDILDEFPLRGRSSSGRSSSSRTRA